MRALHALPVFAFSLCLLVACAIPLGRAGAHELTCVHLRKKYLLSTFRVHVASTACLSLSRLSCCVLPRVPVCARACCIVSLVRSLTVVSHESLQSLPLVCCTSQFDRFHTLPHIPPPHAHSTCLHLHRTKNSSPGHTHTTAGTHRHSERETTQRAHTHTAQTGGPRTADRHKQRLVQHSGASMIRVRVCGGAVAAVSGAGRGLRGGQCGVCRVSLAQPLFSSLLVASPSKGPSMTRRSNRIDGRTRMRS